MSKKLNIRITLIISIVLLFCAGMKIVYNSIPVNVYAMEEDEIIYLEEIDVIDTYEELDVITIKDEPTYDIAEEVIKPYDDNTVEVLTNLLYGEDRSKNKMRQSAVIWCVLNRYDNGHYGKTITDVATAKNQFSGYVKDRVYKDMDSYNRCKEIVIDVLDRYYTDGQPGRTLPKEYLYFVGIDGANCFSIKWRSNIYWDWSLGSPYEE